MRWAKLWFILLIYDGGFQPSWPYDKCWFAYLHQSFFSLSPYLGCGKTKICDMHFYYNAFTIQHMVKSWHLEWNWKSAKLTNTIKSSELSLKQYKGLIILLRCMIGINNINTVRNINLSSSAWLKITLFHSSYRYHHRHLIVHFIIDKSSTSTSITHSIDVATIVDCMVILSTHAQELRTIASKP